MRLIVCRHCESYKNLSDIHGGAGAELTQAGREDALLLGRTFEKRGVTRVVFSPVRQAQDTADLATKVAGVPSSPYGQFRPFGLGVLAGLSRSEAALRFPDSAESMEKWRRGIIKAPELRVQGAELFGPFIERVADGVAELRRHSQDAAAVVGTRSIIMAIVNLLEQGTVRLLEDPTRYRNVIAPFGFLAEYEV